jgi:hypothetical protein
VSEPRTGSAQTPERQLSRRKLLDFGKVGAGQNGVRATIFDLVQQVFNGSAFYGLNARLTREHPPLDMQQGTST